MLYLACQCQISSNPTAIISDLVIKKDPSLRWASMQHWQDMRRICHSPDISCTNGEVPQEADRVDPFHSDQMGRYYWEYLNGPGCCGILYHERAQCYTHIMNSWLLFLEAPPDPEGPVSPDLKEYLVGLVTWSQLLSSCVPGDQDLICRLRHFTLANARKEDVKNVIAWLKVGLSRLFVIVLFVIFICGCCR